MNFDHLLSPQRTPAVFQPSPQHRDGRSRTKVRRVVSDLPTWLEAWNIYLAARLSCVPSLAPELAKYQAIVTSLFAAYRADACVQYDNLSRQCAARDPTIRWDTLKDDIFVWATAPSNNRRKTVESYAYGKPSPFSRLGPPASVGGPRSSERISHTTSGKEICRRFNSGRCTLGERCVYAHTCDSPGCGESHPSRSCPKRAAP